MQINYINRIDWIGGSAICSSEVAANRVLYIGLCSTLCRQHREWPYNLAIVWFIFIRRKIVCAGHAPNEMLDMEVRHIRLTATREN